MVYLFWTFLGLIAYTYLIYPLSIILISLFVSKESDTTSEELPSICMVIPAYNEADCLPEKIKNCFEIDYPNNKIEFLFGSDGSDDETNEILLSSEGEGIQSIIYPRREGKIIVLNKLVEQVTAEIILFSDANSIYQPDAVKKLIRHFSKTDVGGVCGKLDLIEPHQTQSSSGESIYWGYENRIKEAEGKIKSVISANGAIFAIRSTLYERLPEDIAVNDDFAITLDILRKGKRVIFEPQAIAIESASPDMESEFKRKIRIASLNFNAFADIITFLKPKFGFTALAIFSHKILRWLVPFLAIGVLISNLFLINRGGIYLYVLLGQGVIYLGVLLGFLGDLLFDHSGLFLPLYYLGMGNLAQVIGFWHSIKRVQNTTWDRVPH
jgi:cellulose synthase/poly-beta-1,6-N-acetylglucosamine synthase-like glycosyltransferase